MEKDYLNFDSENTFADAIEKAGYPSVYAFAKAVGMAPNMLMRYVKKNDISTMPFSTAIKVAKALNVSPNELREFVPESRQLVDGWNDITPDLSVLVENGRLIRGMRGQGDNATAVFPFLPSDKKDEHEFFNASGCSIEDFDKIFWM